MLNLNRILQYFLQPTSKVVFPQSFMSVLENLCLNLSKDIATNAALFMLFLKQSPDLHTVKLKHFNQERLVLRVQKYLFGMCVIQREMCLVVRLHRDIITNKVVSEAMISKGNPPDGVQTLVAVKGRLKIRTGYEEQEVNVVWRRVATILR